MNSESVRPSVMSDSLQLWIFLLTERNILHVFSSAFKFVLQREHIKSSPKFLCMILMLDSLKNK